VSCVGSSRNHEWMTWATSHCRRETGVGSDGPRSSMWVKSWSESSALIASAAPQNLTIRCAAANLRFGRVEDGRGSLGPLANAPFPISAHRTVDPDFRSTALRLASPQGPQRGRPGQAF
jgi:hypothetical protein